MMAMEHSPFDHLKVEETRLCYISIYQIQNWFITFILSKIVTNFFNNCSTLCLWIWGKITSANQLALNFSMLIIHRQAMSRKYFETCALTLTTDKQS